MKYEGRTVCVFALGGWMPLSETRRDSCAGCVVWDARGLFEAVDSASCPLRFPPFGSEFGLALRPLHLIPCVIHTYAYTHVHTY